MSNNVDERIVEMRFDNKQFESGIQTSMKSLDNLKKGLNFDSAAANLSKLEKAGKSFSLSPMEKSVQTISDRFTNLGIIGVTTLQNITNTAVSAGARMIKALMLDPVLTGFQEYETKMNSITTILTNTQSKGTTLDDVNKALNELNTYADKTIYNFAEMTRNIGTFTAAGVDLDTSVKAIKGIANLAAGSGSSAAQASNAMYQLSQAIAAGRVSLQDWNSVVNAGMGGELFQNALKETAKQMGIVVDESVSFRESISSIGGKDSWLTSDVLVKTLEKFADDESLIKAATQVKTFTQLMDTMKESVQSGWAQTWEYIIGDREEAAELFTSLSDGFNSLIGPSTEARNAMFKFWNEAGGRSAVIEGIGNVLETFGNLLEPIGDAFENVFPPMTGERLVDISNKFLDLTENFKIGEDTAKNVGDTFEGLFSVISLFGKGVSAIVKPVLGLSGGVGTLADTALAATGAFGRFLTKLNESKSINDALDTISESLSKGADGINEFVKSVFTNTGNVNKVLSGFADGVIKILEGIVTNVTKLIKAISDNVSIGDIFAGLAGGGIFVVAKKLADVIGTVKDALDGLFGLGDKVDSIKENFSSVLSSVRDSIDSFTTGIKTTSLLTVAAAIGILSVSLNSISKLKSTDIAKSLSAIAVMMVELNLSLRSMTKTLNKFDSKGLVKSSIAIIAIASAIKILASAMTEIGSLDLAGVGKGLLGIGGALAEMSAFLKLTDLKSVSLKGATSMIAIAAAIKIIAEAVDTFSGLSWDEIGRGLTGFGGSLTGLVAAIKVIGASKVSLRTSIAIIALAESCRLLADATKSFSTMSWDEIARGLTAMGVALAEITASVSVLGKFGGGKSLLGSGSILIVTQSLDEISENLKRLSAMSWNEIGRGLSAMGGALLELSVVSGALGKISGFSGLLGSGSILIAAQALEPIAKTLSSIGSLSWTDIAKGLVGMGGALTELATISGILGSLAGIQSLLGSGAILLGAQALEPIAKALSSIGDMSWGEIGKGIVGMGLALTELSAIIGVLGTLAPIGGLLGGGAILLGVQGLGKLADALKKFGTMSWDEIGRGLVAMGGALTELGVVAGLLGTLSPLSLLGSGSLLLGVQGLGDLADALKKFGAMDWDEIGRGLTAMGAAMGETALGGLLNTFSGIGAGAISEMAPALGTLADSLSKWKNVSVPDGLGTQLGVLADGVMKFTFGGLGAGALSSAAPGLSDMADAVNKWKTVSIPKGIKDGLTDIADGVKSFSFAFLGGWSIDAIVSPLKDLAGAVTKWNSVTIPDNIKEGLESLADGVGSFSWKFAAGWSIDSIVEPLSKLATAAARWNNVEIPVLVGTGLASLANGVGKFSEISISPETLSNFATGLRNIGNAAFSLSVVNFASIGAGLNNFAKTISNIPSELSGTSSGISKALASLSVSIASQSPKITSAFSKLMDGGIAAVQSSIPKFSAIGQTVGTSFATNVTIGVTSRTPAAIASIASMFNSLTRTAQRYLTSSRPKFQNEGKMIMISFVNGITSQKSKATNAVKSIGNATATALNGYRHRFQSVGSDMIQGLINGINSKRYRAINAAASVAADALRAAKRALDSNSPSKKFERLGEDSDEGLAIGFTNNRKHVISSAESVAGAMLDTVGIVLNRLPTLLSSDVDLSPRITPVLDLSSVRKSAGTIGTMLQMDTLRVSKLVTDSKDVTKSRKSMNSASDDDINRAPYQKVENTYNQYVNSPKAISRTDLYRQTKNLFALEKGVVQS